MNRPVHIMVPAAIVALASSPHAGAQVMDVVDGGRGPVPLYVPSDYDPGEPLPLIVALHGYSMTDSDIEAYFNLVEQVESSRFLYVVPEGERDLLGSPFWNATDACCDFFGENPDDSGYLRELIETVRAQYSVDALSIHLVGYSNGGFMAFRMACDHSDLIASIVSLAGRSHEDPGDCTPSEAVHILHISGTSDDVIRFNGGCTFTGCYPSAPETVLDWALENGCDPSDRPLGEPFDMDVLVPGNEASTRIYDSACDGGVTSELWTLAGSTHGPEFWDPFAGEGPEDNRLAILGVDWLLSHRKATCAADLTGDGQADSDDFFLFLDAFSSGATDVCDLTGDGACDSEDFFLFLDQFVACG